MMYFTLVSCGTVRLYHVVFHERMLVRTYVLVEGGVQCTMKSVSTVCNRKEIKSVPSRVSVQDVMLQKL